MEAAHDQVIADPAIPCRRDHARPRVLRVATRLNRELGRHALDLTIGIRERGFDTRLVSGGSGPEGDDIDPPPGVAHTYVPWLGHSFKPGDDLRAGAAIAGVVRRWKPDVVHSHLAKAGALARMAAISAGVPVVVHSFHDRVLKEYLSALRNGAFAKVERRLAARTDALIAVAPWIRDELLSAGIGRPAQWHVVPIEDGCVRDLAELYAALLARAEARMPGGGRARVAYGRVPA